MSVRCGVLEAAVLAFLLAAAGTLPAAAATKRINPLDFAPSDSSVSVMRSPLGIGGVAVAAEFFAPLALPPGARITGMRAYGNGVAASRTATIFRVNSSTEAPIAIATTDAAAPDLFTPAAVPGVLVPDPAALRVEPNFLYVVRVICSPGTAVWAVDVDFVP